MIELDTYELTAQFERDWPKDVTDWINYDVTNSNLLLFLKAEKEKLQNVTWNNLINKYTDDLLGIIIKDKAILGKELERFELLQLINVLTHEETIELTLKELCQPQFRMIQGEYNLRDHFYTTENKIFEKCLDRLKAHRYYAFKTIFKGKTDYFVAGSTLQNNQIEYHVFIYGLKI